MPEPLRVAMIIQAYHPRIGGAEKLVGSLAPRLAERQVEVHVVTRRYPGTLAREHLDGAEVHRLSFPGDSGRLQKAAASLTFSLSALPLLGKLRPHILHAHELLSPATTAVAAKSLFGAAVVATVHGGGRGPQSELARLLANPLGRQRMRLFSRRIDRFQCISRDIDQQLEELGVAPEKRLLLSNGVDTDRFRPAEPELKRTLRRRLNLSPRQRVVLYVGRLSPEKRVDNLIRVWPKIRQSDETLRLVILGTGPREEELKRLAGEGVFFAGQSADVLPWLQTAEIFVLPSVAEGISIALLEAMSCSLPVLATSGGGNPELIQHGESGWLVPPDDLSALEEALRTLVRRVDLRASLARCARLRIEKNYSLAHTVDGLLDLYRHLAETKGRKER